MSQPATSTDRTRPKATQPRPGSARVSRRTALALELSASWPNRTERALLVLLGILADEHRRAIEARKLAAAIGVDVPELDRLLHRLAVRGLIWTTRRPQRLNQYTLLFAGERVPTQDRDRFRRWQRAHFDREERNVRAR